MKKIEVSAPGKLMLFGEHAVVYNRPCIVTAVDQRIRVSLESILGDKIKIEAPDVGIGDYTKKLNLLSQNQNSPKGVRFLEAAIKNFFEEYKVKSGLKIKTKSEFSSQFGFGSSSAVTVAVLKGLSQLFAIKMDNKKLFDLAYQTVLEVQGIGSGFDLAAAIWGGTIFFFTGGKTIIPLKIKRLPLVVAYSGIKADTPALVRQVAILSQHFPKLVESIFDSIAFLVLEAKEGLEKGELERVGQLMNFDQGLLEALGVNTPKLAKLVFAARQAGAYGAKLSGAGGGDCMIALVSNRNRARIKKVIEKEGGEIIHVKTGASGTQIE